MLLLHPFQNSFVIYRKNCINNKVSLSQNFGIGFVHMLLVYVLPHYFLIQALIRLIFVRITNNINIFKYMYAKYFIKNSVVGKLNFVKSTVRLHNSK